MRSYRLIIALTVLCAATLLVPALAVAVGPAESPVTIRSEGFETLPYGSDLSIAPVVLTPPATAYWGRITQRKHSGTYGLWCAGTTTFGVYPQFTYGVARFELPQLADYYSASFTYWYMMPSKGVDDYFHAMWDTAPGGSWDVQARPISAAWTQETWDLTAATNSRNLSRKASVARFGFIDMVEGYGSSPTVGEGPTIDDVVFSGYKFGPVRDLAAGVVDGKAHVTWETPWRSTEATSAEERPVAYRVWRSPDVAPYVWTELTSSRQTEVTFDDPASLDGDYRYAVQPWDTGTGTGYGTYVSAAVALGTPPAPPTDPSGLVLASGTPAPSVELTWTDNATGEDGYVVERSENGGAFAAIGSLPADSTSYRDVLDGLSGARQWGSIWAYRVKAHTAGVSSGYATSAGIRLDTTPPTTSAVVGATYLSPASITILADDAQSGVAWTEYQVDSSAAASGSVAVVPAYGTHTIVHRAMDVAGNLGDWSAPQTFTVLTPTSVSAPSVSTSRPRRGRYATFTAYLSPGAAALTAPSTLRLYRYETKTVRKKVRGHWRRVRVKYWRLRNAIVMTPNPSGGLTAASKPRYAGKWMAQVSFSGGAIYAASDSGSRTFTVR